MGTILNQLHPYPAMVADHVAIEIANKHVTEGASVLDPYCGSGRLIAAAASMGTDCTGTDVNPLACLITAAKFASPDKKELKKALHKGFRTNYRSKFTSKENRKVAWFSESTLHQLSSIVRWINSRDADLDTKIVFAVALSATVRATSYCKKRGWKLHRMNQEERKRFRPDVYSTYKKYISYYLKETQEANALKANCEVLCGQAELLIPQKNKKYDTLITSPPYGDSFTTVHYGGMSSICLDFISNIDELEGYFQHGCTIDAKALGGRKNYTNIEGLNVKQFWKGAKTNTGYERIALFLSSYKESIKSLVSSMKSKSNAVFIVGNRSVGGFRLYLDRFTEACMADLGYIHDSTSYRDIYKQSVPLRINKYGASKSSKKKNSGVVKTIVEESILSFSRQ